MLMHDERGFAVRTRTEIGCARLSDDPVSATDRGMAVKMEQLQRAYDRQACDACAFLQDDIFGQDQRRTDPDRKSVVEGKSVAVRVDLGGCRIIKNKKTKKH